MNQFQLTYKPYGDSAILISWPSEISTTILSDIKNFVLKIKNLSIEKILEFSFIYNSLLVIYDNKKINNFELETLLKSIYKSQTKTLQIEAKIWNVPVCYSEEFGVDLAIVSKEKQLSFDEIITLHCKPIYTVYGIGFLPGFLYLGGLSKKLTILRKETPRLSVPKGAVGLAGNQTGIYPQDSPGGWQIIGKTPISLFNVKDAIPCEISPGDSLKFHKISKEDFNEISVLQSKGLYKLKSTILT